jgi:hypothetical protein
MLRAALLTLCLCSLASAAYPPAIQHEAQPYHRAVVRVDAGQGIGSGTLIAKHGNLGIVLTAHHVTSHQPLHVQYAGHEVGSTAQLIAAHPLLDISALHVWVPEGIEPIPVASERPAIGTEVELAGFGGWRWNTLRSTVRGYYTHRYSTATDIGISHISIPGESGGPILVFEQGEPRVAGVNWGGMTDQRYKVSPMKWSQACDATQIRHWLSYAVAPRFPWVLPAEIEVRGAE